MFHLKDRQHFNHRLSFSSVVVSFHTVVLLLLLLTRCCEGQSQVIGPFKPVVAITGDDIILPCHLDPAVDAVSMPMEWTRPDLRPRFVHVRRGGHDLLVNQNPAYEGRTSVSIDQVQHGNVSLKLSRVKLSDAGTYRCFFPLQGEDGFVQLVVGAVSSPVIVSVNRTSTGVAVQCESAGWYPEPEVLWLDGEGKLLPAGPTETVRGPDDLYTVSSRVTVEKRHSNSFTCRVQQRDISQTTETHIQYTEDVFTAPSCSAVRITIILSVCILFSCICAALLVFGKRRQNKGQNKKQTADGAEEEQLLKGRTNMKELLDEKSEEKKDMEHVISVLTEEKTELESSIDKLKTQLEEVEEEKKKIERKLGKLDKNFAVHIDDKRVTLLQDKLDRDNKKTEYQKSVQRTEEKLQKTEDMIKRITDCKKKVERQLELMKKQLEETKTQREESQLKLNSEQPGGEGTDTNTESLA